MKETDYSFKEKKEMENKGVILLDIDNTVIDTKKLSLLAYTDIAKQTGKTPEQIFELKDEYKDSLESNTDFYPPRLMAFLEKKIEEPIDNPFDKEEYYKESLFEGVIELLTELGKTNKLGTYTEGHTDYQTNKLVLSGIIDFFDKDLIFIKRRKLDNESLNEIPDGAIVIDDNRKVVEKLNTIKRFKTIWLNMSNNETIEGISTIKNLNEVPDLVKVKV